MMNKFILGSAPKYGSFLSLHVLNEHNKFITICTREFTPLESLMKKYSSATNIPLEDLRFSYNDNRIHPHISAGILGMTNNDLIMVSTPLIGGGMVQEETKCETKTIDLTQNSHEDYPDNIQQLLSYIESLSSTNTRDPRFKRIKVNVFGVDGSTVKFKIFNTTPFRRLITKYCEILNLHQETLRFRFDGQPVNPEYTPAALEMSSDEENTIEVYLQQIGGGNNETSNQQNHPTKKSNDTDTKIQMESNPLTDPMVHQMQKIAIDTRSPRASWYEAPAKPIGSGTIKKRGTGLQYSSILKRATKIPEWNPFDDHQYSNIQRLFQNKPITVCIEGNIAAGKSTLIHQLKKMAPVFTLREPLEEWRDTCNTNLLRLTYQKPRQWAFPFQMCAMLMMVKNHLHPARNKIMERSVNCTKEVFLEAHKILNHIEPSQVKIIHEWYDLVSSHLHTKIDLIIYLKTNPEIAFERMMKRKRYEERNVKISYLEIVDDLYNRWIENIIGTRVITINGNENPEQIVNELNTKLKNIV